MGVERVDATRHGGQLQEDSAIRFLEYRFSRCSRFDLFPERDTKLWMRDDERSWPGLGGHRAVRRRVEAWLESRASVREATPLETGKSIPLFPQICDTSDEPGLSSERARPTALCRAPWLQERIVKRREGIRVWSSFTCRF